jgi:hypothetical protein
LPTILPWQGTAQQKPCQCSTSQTLPDNIPALGVLAKKIFSVISLNPKTHIFREIFVSQSGKTPQNLHVSKRGLFRSAMPLHLLLPYPYFLQCFIFPAVLSTPCFSNDI